MGRFEVFLARFLGAATIVGAAQFVAGLCAIGVSLALDRGSRGGELSEILTYGSLVTLALVAYGTSFVALMSLLSAWIGSPGLAAVAGLLGNVLLLLLVSAVSQRMPALGLFQYLVPSGSKFSLISPELGPMVLGILAQPLYVAAFLAAGWRVFSRRDV